MLLKQIFRDFFSDKRNDQFGRVYRALIHREAIMGGRLFGPLPKGARREFFCLDEHTWVWHEEWIDNNKQRQVMTTRYNIRPSGILKSQNNGVYQPITKQEAQRFIRAVDLYMRQARHELYPSAA